MREARKMGEKEIFPAFEVPGNSAFSVGSLSPLT